jgi:hypothetical protein
MFEEDKLFNKKFLQSKPKQEQQQTTAFNKALTEFKQNGRKKIPGLKRLRSCNICNKTFFTDKKIKKVCDNCLRLEELQRKKNYKRTRAKYNIKTMLKLTAEEKKQLYKLIFKH